MLFRDKLPPELVVAFTCGMAIEMPVAVATS